MKSFIQKVLMLVGLVSVVPFFSYAASVSCRADYSNDLVGETVNISATVNGGNGTAYDFSWSGDDGLDANGESFSYSFTQEGSMTINVTASSTDSSDLLNGSCSVNIYTDATLPDYSASCLPSTDRAVIGQDITWNPTINGPLGPYTVTSWTGTDSLSDASVAYASSGDKFATMVSFESRYGSATPVHNAKLSNIACSASTYVIPEEIHNPTELTITGTCAAADSSVYTNDTVVWNSNLNISGGAAPYQITWSDSLGSMGVGTSVSKSYSAIGTISAFLSVEDNAGQSSDITCSNVTVRNHSSGGGNTVTITDGDTATSTATSTATTTSSTSTSTATTTTTTSTSTSTATSTPGTNGGNDDESDNDLLTGDEGTDGSGAGENISGYEVGDDFTFGTDQNPGTYSQDVANLQSRLMEEGFYAGLIGGFFGPATEAALRAFQAANGLDVNGVLDTQTREKLNALKDAASNIKGGDVTKTGFSFPAMTAAVYDFAGANWPVVLYALLVALAIGLVSWLFVVIKKSDKTEDNK